MTERAGFDVPAGERREPTAAERFARRQVEAPPEDPRAEPELERAPRMVSLQAVTDFASGVLITAGLTLLTVAAWHYLGTGAGLAALGGSLVVLGFLLGL